MRTARANGFTLIELMVTVAILGVLASLALSEFQTQRYRSRAAEASVNLRAIQTMETIFAASRDRFMAARASPGAPGRQAMAWVDAGDFATLGWVPEGRVYFQYEIAVDATEKAYVAAARADLDGDGVDQVWAVDGALPDAGGPATCPFGGTILEPGRVHLLTPSVF